VETPREEVLWVLSAQCDDREALEQLLRGVQPALRRYLIGLVGATAADDVLQQALVLVYRKLGSLERPDLFRPWAFRIASREAFRHLKKERRWLTRENDDSLLDDLPAPDAAPAATLPSDLLEMTDISPASRAVLILHFQQELTLPDVAAVLEIPLGTVKSRLSYGLAALRKRLGHNRSV
jgi:RNA polymerase sigma-70 factor (ECF subfamily)